MKEEAFEAMEVDGKRGEKNLEKLDSSATSQITIT